METVANIKFEENQYACKIEFKFALNKEMKFKRITSKCSGSSKSNKIEKNISLRGF